ncbi:4a-hydroxytetrahydrobiopterin dehydratase [Patescibacteria group bacterium]|nr:4a-hydroxytetrahydrobiopterin dehydratase [Patescibacteria group bacterium]
MEKLTEKKCVPCEGGTPPLNEEEIQAYAGQLQGEWEAIDEKKIQKQFSFKNFKEALAFVNKVGEIAESEGHHPDIRLFGYKNVEIELSTHAIGGLSENDFIVAAKIEQLSA